MNRSEFFVSFSLVLSTTFCGCVLAENFPPDPGISHLGIWWTTSDEQSSPIIDHFYFVILFDDKEAFEVPFKVQNSELAHLNPANAGELASDKSGVTQFPSVRLEARVGASQSDTVNVIIAPFRIVSLSISGREITSMLFNPGGTDSVPDDSIEIVSTDGSRSSKALAMEK